MLICVDRLQIINYQFSLVMIKLNDCILSTEKNMQTVFYNYYEHDNLQECGFARYLGCIIHSLFTSKTARQQDIRYKGDYKIHQIISFLYLQSKCLVPLNKNVYAEPQFNVILFMIARFSILQLLKILLKITNKVKQRSRRVLHN